LSFVSAVGAHFVPVGGIYPFFARQTVGKIVDEGRQRRERFAEPYERASGRRTQA
jgi:hypothetical protein